MKKIEPSFWDTSALVSLCAPHEAIAPLYQRLHRQGQMVVWWGTSVEIVSAFCRLSREGTIPRDGLQPLLARFAELRQVWVEVLPSEQLRRLAEVMPEKHSLRAGDAFQLAAALVWCNEQPRYRPFVCFDRRLAKAAEEAGFAVLSQP